MAPFFISISRQIRCFQKLTFFVTLHLLVCSSQNPIQ